MTISLYKASAPIFVQFLTSLSAVLDKAAAHAEAKKIDPAVLLNTRLTPDMYPLRETTNHAASACGRLAGAAGEFERNLIVLCAIDLGRLQTLDEIDRLGDAIL